MSVKVKPQLNQKPHMHAARLPRKPQLTKPHMPLNNNEVRIVSRKTQLSQKILTQFLPHSINQTSTSTQLLYVVCSSVVTLHLIHIFSTLPLTRISMYALRM